MQIMFSTNIKKTADEKVGGLSEGVLDVLFRYLRPGNHPMAMMGEAQPRRSQRGPPVPTTCFVGFCS
jgi:hypothetical protein